MTNTIGLEGGGVMVMNPIKLLQPEYHFLWKWLPPEQLAELERLVLSLERHQNGSD